MLQTRSESVESQIAELEKRLIKRQATTDKMQSELNALKERLKSVREAENEKAEKLFEIVRLRVKEKKTLKEVGEIFNLSAGRIRELESEWYRKQRKVNCKNCWHCLELVKYYKLFGDYALENEFLSTKMILCPTCGNKRCPKANNHIYECTNSNATGQKDSAYP